jgi:tetratricopeptide (TPR) repeat protein
MLVGSASCTQDHETHLERALRYKANGDLTQALTEIHAAVGEAPKDAELRRQSGLIYLDNGDGAAAEIEFRKAFELGTHADDEINLALARSLLLQNKHAALDVFLKGKTFSSNATALPASILAAQALDRIDEQRARRAFLEVLKQLDKRSFPHADTIDTGAVLAALTSERDRYPSLKAAIDYRDRLRNLPVGQWITLHQQTANDEVFFFRQNHGGSAFDTKRGRLVLFGSDTHDYGDIMGKNWSNSVYFFDPAVGVWTESYPKDPVASYTVNDAGLPVAGERADHPWAMHTYGALAYDPRLDQMVVASYPAHEEPGKFTYLLQKIWPRIQRHPTWLYDLASNRWSALDAPAESFFQNTIAYDSDRDVIVGYKDTGVFELSGSPRTWNRIFDKGLLGPDNNMVYDSKHKTLVVFGGVPLSNDVAIYEPSTRRHEIMPTPGLRPPKYRFAPMAFHPRLGKTVVLVERRGPKEQHDRGGTTETWLYDLGSDAWQQVTSATLDYGIYRNYDLQYDPDHDFLLLIPNPYGPSASRRFWLCVFEIRYFTSSISLGLQLLSKNGSSGLYSRRIVNQPFSGIV